MKAILGTAAKDIAVDAAINGAMTAGIAGATDLFDPRDLDPTGIAQTVRAFNHPICSNIDWSKYQ